MSPPGLLTAVQAGGTKDGSEPGQQKHRAEPSLSTGGNLCDRMGMKSQVFHGGPGEAGPFSGPPGGRGFP
jgi:hypothetical protein